MKNDFLNPVITVEKNEKFKLKMMVLMLKYKVMTDWEKKFYDSLRIQYEIDGALTQKQYGKINELMYKYRKDE